MDIRIAFLQLLPGDSPGEQLEIGKKACRKARERGADIALFPEMWSSGYRIPQDRDELKNLAVERDGPFVMSFRNLSAELEMAIGTTCLEEHEPAPLNSLIVVDRRGEEVLHYSKVHTCAFDQERVLSSGNVI